MLGLYDYLFYKSYQSAVSSKNFDGMLVFGAITFVAPCIMFNVFTVFLILEKQGWIGVTFDKGNRFIFALSLLGIVYFYYVYKGRYKRIIEKWERKEKNKRFVLHPILVFILYYGTTAFLMFLAGFYKNSIWIFQDI